MGSLADLGTQKRSNIGIYRQGFIIVVATTKFLHMNFTERGTLAKFGGVV